MQKQSNVKRKTSKKKNSRSRSWEDRQSRDDRRDSRRKEGEESTTSNDPRWYATDPALLRDAASIPFSWPLGQEFSDGFYRTALGVTSDHKITIPGICAVELCPTMGAGNRSDALNIAAAATYSYVRYANSGHANYDPNDLMLYIIGMSNVYSYINYLERVYALATVYEQRNRYLPKALLKAMYIDADSITTNLADFRYAINVLINKVSSICVPATMTLFLRQAMIYSYVYAEGESVKDQLYLFYPHGFYRFALDDESAGMLEYIPMDYSHLLTWQNLISYGETMFGKIWEQEDFGIMSGDILKAYNGNILTLSSLDEVVPFAPVYDPMVLHQIKNATIFNGTMLNIDSMDIKQDSTKSRLVHEVLFSGTSGYQYISNVYAAESNKVLTLDAADPTPEMVIEATRLMAGLTGRSAGGTYTVRPCTGSEMVTKVHLYTLTDIETLTMDDVVVDNYPVVDQSISWDLVHLLGVNKAFKFSPGFAVLNTDGDPGNESITNVAQVREVDNYAVLSSEDVNKLHTTALLNMLNVPSTAKNIKFNA